jgi:hypothetical protein
MLRTSLAAALLSAVALIQPADAQRVCRQDCVGPICTEKCTENSGAVIIDRDRHSTDGRGLRGQEPDLVIEERRRHRDPAIELRAPGVGIEIGR